MTRIRTAGFLAGLCLVAVLLMGMVAAGSASAVGTYKTCQEVSGTGTKYAAEGCETAEAAGKWEVAELKGTEKAVLAGTLVLTDTKTAVGEVSVSCSSEEARGVVGPGKLGKVTAINKINCTSIKGCEAGSVKAEADGLPWKTELAEVENSEKAKTAGVKLESEKEEAGWTIKCKVAGLSVEDKCLTNKGLLNYVSLLYTKGFFNNPAGNRRWLLFLEFLNYPGRRATCSQSKEETGIVSGRVLLLAFRGSGVDVNLLLF
jgi:hypothetical protein